MRLNFVLSYTTQLSCIVVVLLSLGNDMPVGCHSIIVRQLL